MTYEERSRALREKATVGPWTAWLREDYDAERFLTYRQHTVIDVGGGVLAVLVVVTNDRPVAEAILPVFTHNTAEAVERVIAAARAVQEVVRDGNLHNALAALDGLVSEC